MTTPMAPRHPNERRFEEFFIRDSYVTLKNYLYNYLERKRVINRRLARVPRGRVLEVGSGLSPIVTDRDDVIYSELSFRGMQTLKRVQQRGQFIVADGTRLPFASDSLDQVICSEVLEHVEDDQAALNEIARVLRPGGVVYVTVPHRRAYFAADDRYVRHFRRYEIGEMNFKFGRAGFEEPRITKVLGPLEKLTMWSVVTSLLAIERMSNRDAPAADKRDSAAAPMLRVVLHPLFKYAHRVYALIARVDATVAPQSLAAVLLFEGVKIVPTDIHILHRQS